MKSSTTATPSSVVETQPERPEPSPTKGAAKTTGTGGGAKPAFLALASLNAVAAAVSAGSLLVYWSSGGKDSVLLPIFGAPDAPTIGQIMIGMVSTQGALLLLTWLVSFDTRAPKRPRLGMTVSSLAAGLMVGVFFAALIFQDQLLAEVGGKVAILAGMLGVPAGWLLVEWLIATMISAMLAQAEAQGAGARALALSKALLPFRPGSSATFRAVALERFKRGERTPALLSELDALFDAYDRGDDLLEALMRWAAERRDPARYLQMLTLLHEVRPEDEDLVEALIEEHRAQNNSREALKLVERVGPDEESQRELERYAELLAECDRFDDAITTAEKLAELEGMPFKSSGKILRRVLERNNSLVKAHNLLGDQASRSRNLDQAARRYEASLAVKPDQPDVKRRLLAIHRETSQIDATVKLLAEMLKDPKELADDGLCIEYADALLATKKTAEAKQFLSERVRAGATSYPFQDRMAEALVTLQEWTEASEFNVRASEKAAGEEARSRCRQRAARIERALLSAELYDLQQEVAKKPDDSGLALQLVRRLIESKQLERATNQADALVRRDPKTREGVIEVLREMGLAPGGPFLILSYLSDLYIAGGDTDAAFALIPAMRERSLSPDAAEREVCEKIIRRQPNHLQSLKALGALHDREHQFTETVHYYMLYVAHGGEATPEVAGALFEAYAELGDFTNALKFGQPLIDAEPADDRRPMRLAEIALKVKALEVAEKWAEVTLQRNAKNTTAQRIAREVRSQQHEKESAELQRRVDAGTATPADLERLADILQEQKKFDAAIPLFQRAARDAARTTRAKAKLALCLAEKGLYDLANETLQGVEPPTDPDEGRDILELLYMVARHFEDERMTERAVEIYKRIFRCDAGFKDVVKKIERYSQ